MTEENEVKYERVVSKGPLPYYYIKLKLEFEDDDFALGDVSDRQLKALIVRMVKEVYGQVGSSVQIDLLKYSQKEGTAILRVPHSSAVKIWSALTMCSTYQGKSCALRVLQTSSHLMALAVDTRNLDF